MSKSMNKLALAVGALMVVGSAIAETTTATIGATVIAPIGIAQGTGLVFGNLAAGNGTVTVSTNSARVANGTLTQMSTGVTPVAARFDVTGQGTQTFSISYTGTSSELTGPTGADPMAFTLITESIPGAAATATNKVSGTAATGALLNGAATIFAGGAVTVAGLQTPGSYTGTVSVSVDYN
jgi:hypothetical protein